MIQVSPLRDVTKKNFEKLFADYYTELGCDDDASHLLGEYVIPDALAGLCRIDIICDGDECAGFAIYQIDDIDNDWNFKEGWGDIREIYIAPTFRKKGLGKFLLYTAEMKLKESGAKRAYCLPAEGTQGFFTACGYASSDEYCEELDCPVFVKHNLNNKCHE